ncbi:sugar nucleotide-binding protein [Streptomyces sp. NPDC059650]|uniref:sugar nucleotide-binding protein n=1 Tax=Streptomyces sp. NPDC059650 TaxID=3346896 RepID=UPI0036AE952B
MTVLIIGSSGFLGAELVRQAVSMDGRPGHHVPIPSRRRRQGDLASPRSSRPHPFGESDAVFSGTGHDRYDESSLPDPLTPYGAAKAASETAVRLLCPDAVVARTSLITGHSRSEHEQLVHALAAGTRQGALFTDDIRCPVHVNDLAWSWAGRRGPKHCPHPFVWSGTHDRPRGVFTG